MDYYQILNISRKATQEDIQKAYHALAVQHHPDANHGDAHAAEKFKEINKAYQTLRNPEKRREYDLELEPGHAKASTGVPRTPQGSRAGQRGPVTTPGNPLGDILGDMMNTARGNAGGQAANSKENKNESSGVPIIELKLTTREALAGTEKTILVNGRPLRIKITVVR